jgi:hypothetical protein
MDLVQRTRHEPLEIDRKLTGNISCKHNGMKISYSLGPGISRPRILRRNSVDLAMRDKDLFSQGTTISPQYSDLARDTEIAIWKERANTLATKLKIAETERDLNRTNYTALNLEYEQLKSYKNVLSQLAANQEAPAREYKKQVQELQGQLQQKERELQNINAMFREDFDTQMSVKNQKIADLQAEHLSLSNRIFQNVGQDQFITQDQMRSLVSDMYHETSHFCPEFFNFPGENNSKIRLVIENRSEWAPVKHHGTGIYYYFTESKVLESILLKTSTIADWRALEDNHTGLLLMKSFINFDKAILLEDHPSSKYSESHFLYIPPDTNNYNRTRKRHTESLVRYSAADS